MEGWCGRGRMCSWRSRCSSSSARLLGFMVPLAVVFGLIAFGGIKGSSWMFALNSHPWVWPSVIKSTPFSGDGTTLSSNVIEDPMLLSPPKGRGDTADFRPKLPSAGSGAVGGVSEEPPSIHFIINQSAPSPPRLATENIQTENPMEDKEVTLNITANSTTQMYPSFNGTHVLPLSARIKGRSKQLERLEARMQKARTAIRGARYGNQSLDPDFIPTSPMYWNANAFHSSEKKSHNIQGTSILPARSKLDMTRSKWIILLSISSHIRSYLEMEKQFKVYVYEEGEPPIFHNGPCKSIYAMEGNFIYYMETSKFRTKDPHKALVFFLPISMTTIVHFIYDKKSKDHWHPLKRTVGDYVHLIAGKYPYWNRSHGADHFILACHDWGPELSLSVPELHKNSIRCFCNANTSEGFNPSKDVSFPEIHLPGGTINGLIGGPSPSKRPILFFFAGGLHGPIRPILLEHWENRDEDVQVHMYLSKGVSYYGMMKKSKYCICPSGYEVASPRLVEALYTGCVPVIIKDHYVAPFSDVLNWKAFSVDIPVKDIPNLKRILAGISTRQYIRMQRRGRQVRRHFEVSFPPKRYDVFHMILHSVWLRRLNIRLHGDEDS